MKRNIITILCLLTVTYTWAQQLKVELTEINDLRGTGYFSGCEIKLSLSGPVLQGAELIKFDTAITVTDDLGTSLSKEDSFGFHRDQFEEVELEDNKMERKIDLRNPPRKASSIRVLKGKVHVYNPSLDTKSKITSKGFTNRPNQSLLTVKDPSFDVLYVDAEAYKFMQQAEKEKINKQIALLSESGQQTAKQASSFFDSFNNADVGPNALHFYVKDLNAQLLKFEFRDENGQVTEPGMTREGSNMYSFGFRKPVTQAWQITVFLLTPKSLITIPYELKNITLP